MKRFFDDKSIYENILLVYYSNEQELIKNIFNNKIEIVMERFLDVLASEDMVKGTNHTKLIKEIYSNNEFENRSEYLKSLHLSYGTLRRYREKYCATLKLLLDRFND